MHQYFLLLTRSLTVYICCDKIQFQQKHEILEKPQKRNAALNYEANQTHLEIPTIIDRVNRTEKSKSEKEIEGTFRTH